MADVYQDEVLKHSREPKGYGVLPKPMGSRVGVNSLCGDEVHLTLSKGDASAIDLAFESQGCALCRASASMMVATSAGLDANAAAREARAFVDAFKGGGEPSPQMARLRLLALLELRRYPTRARCVLLPWETLIEALSSPPFAESR